MGLPPRLENQRVYYFWMSRGRGFCTPRLLGQRYTRLQCTEQVQSTVVTGTVRTRYGMYTLSCIDRGLLPYRLHNTVVQHIAHWAFRVKLFANTFTSITLRRTRAHRHNSDSTNPHARSGPTIPTNYAIRDAFFPVPAEPYHHTTATRTHHRSRTSASLSVR